MGGTVNIYNALSFNLVATCRPRFFSGIFKTLGYMYAELESRRLGEKWAHSLRPPLSVSVGSTQRTGSQLTTASPGPNTGVMPLPGVELYEDNLHQQLQGSFSSLFASKTCPNEDTPQTYTYLP